MRDVNLPIRKAYIAALAAIGCPVYYQVVPDSVLIDVYAVIERISNNDASTMNSSDVTATVQLTVFTHSASYNTGVVCDTKAGLIMTALKPTPQYQITADGVQVVSTKLQSDNTNNYTINNTRNYVDRTLVFQHHIFINS